MKKKLTTVGNSKAVILPTEMVKKYNLIESGVIIEETEQGILIRPSQESNSFAKALDNLRRKKHEVYRRMEQQANDPDTQAYYKSTGLDDVDTDVVES